MQSPHITDVTQHNFREVIERSASTPILFYFWAPMSDESAQLIPALQQLTQQYDGAFQLAQLNCQEEQAIAAQFGIQALPTIALFINGQPVDGLGGPQPIAAIQEMLDRHLPSQDERTLQQALTLVQNQQQAQALPLLLSLSDEWKRKGDAKLALADCFLATQQFEAAKAELAAIPLEYQDGYYKSLVARLELHEQAADSPEIQALESKFAQDNSNAKVAIELATQYHQVQRDEEALELLWSFLKRDLNTLDGDMKKIFMDILNALGQSNSTASRYRRQLYSLLY
ncbi:co-chaperone YbbN [Vibrio fluvialis]|uniref:co-chaperone YbbN n=1 Tax=Vibrio fluvialis TaxID=676 RepID=UPI0015595B7E|nr:co-chaperone YbbN [Vibrio fluvialis]EKO3462814.1 co-chaperone YbbN [Vibrio fluvialis]EKO3539058.1 co-chaperone YbbN [Vibrio fluvialis]EKO5122201.1 co-chaperone YbbN [Vibrio fluvialis]ELE2166018.1 co-chaperone YbbN [Vibrio fluvialis]ELO4019910.1 co-chaperone YbbN [Vibrio fluvialis]